MKPIRAVSISISFLSSALDYPSSQVAAAVATIVSVAINCVRVCVRVFVYDRSNFFLSARLDTDAVVFFF